jgi:hypothetical protein
MGCPSLPSEADESLTAAPRTLVDMISYDTPKAYGWSLGNAGERPMSEAITHGTVVGEPLQRSIIARPIEGGAVHTIIGPEPGQRGPWSFITDTPHPTQDMVGPPATYLAVAAWAA